MQRELTVLLLLDYQKLDEKSSDSPIRCEGETVSAVQYTQTLFTCRYYFLFLSTSQLHQFNSREHFVFFSPFDMLFNHRISFIELSLQSAEKLFRHKDRKFCLLQYFACFENSLNSPYFELSAPCIFMCLILKCLSLSFCICYSQSYSTNTHGAGN